MRSKRRRRSRKTKASLRCLEDGSWRWTAQRPNSRGMLLERSKAGAAGAYPGLVETWAHSWIVNLSSFSFFYRITVTFNVNNSIPPNFEEEAEQGQQKSAEEEVSSAILVFSEDVLEKMWAVVTDWKWPIKVVVIKIWTIIWNCVFPSQPEIVSTPNFVVEVTKQASKHSLVFDCHFPEDEVSSRLHLYRSEHMSCVVLRAEATFLSDSSVLS